MPKHTVEKPRSVKLKGKKGKSCSSLSFGKCTEDWGVLIILIRALGISCIDKETKMSSSQIDFETCSILFTCNQSHI